MAKLEGKVDLWSHSTKVASLPLLSIICCDTNASLELLSVLDFKQCSELIIVDIKPRLLRWDLMEFTLPSNLNKLEVLVLGKTAPVFRFNNPSTGPGSRCLQRLSLPRGSKSILKSLSELKLCERDTIESLACLSNGTIPRFELDLSAGSSDINMLSDQLERVEIKTSSVDVEYVELAMRRANCVKITMEPMNRLIAAMWGDMGSDYKRRPLSSDSLRNLEIVGLGSHSDPRTGHVITEKFPMGAFHAMIDLTMVQSSTTLNGDDFPQLRSLTFADGDLKLENNFPKLRSITLKNATLDMEEKSACPLLQRFSFDRVGGMNKVLVSKTRFPLLQEVSFLHSKISPRDEDPFSRHPRPIAREPIMRCTPIFRPVVEADAVLPVVLRLDSRLGAKNINIVKALVPGWQIGRAHV